MLRNLNGGRAATAALLALALGALAPRAALSQDPAAPARRAPEPGIVVDSVVVRARAACRPRRCAPPRGSRRAPRVTAVQVQAAIRRLMASQAYASADVLVRETARRPRRGDLQVVERPWIAAVEFRGLKSLGGNAIRDSARLKEGAPLNPQRVKDAERLVRDGLAKKGIQLVSIDTSLVAMPAGAEGYRLVFNVREGSRLTLADVDSRGTRRSPTRSSPGR